MNKSKLKRYHEQKDWETVPGRVQQIIMMNSSQGRKKVENRKDKESR